MMCLLAMMVASLSAKAQEVTITLFPGWNWISYPKAETQDISTALGDFEPVNGDMLKSQFGNAVYSNGYWRGSVTHFIPGWGYKYYSNRTEVVSFVFGEVAPQLTVTTAEPTDITATSAISGGSITSNDGSYVFVLEKGICWATHPNPMVMNDSFTQNGNGPDSFTAEMTDLTPNTVYYVRAYAVTLNGTTYGDELSFNTQRWVNGVLPGLFSVSENQQVHFSQGNLQYLGSVDTPYWRFAENQWDFFGTTTGQNSNNHNVDRDLFGWGTSGWDNGNLYYQPYDTDNNGNTYNGYGYGPIGSNGTIYNQNLTGINANADWGVFNAIFNGGNQLNQWRTLTNVEWVYIFNYRTTTSGIRYAKAIVNNVKGIILLPDDWDASNFILNNTNNGSNGYNVNTITAVDWVNIFETSGAVFLPAAGVRAGSSIVRINEGYYWSTSISGYTPLLLSFDDSSLHPSNGWVGELGLCVRLVCPVE